MDRSYVLIMGGGPARCLVRGVCVCVCVQLLGRVQLCDPMDSRQPGPSVHRIPQARILEQALPDPGIKPGSFVFYALAGGFFTTSSAWEASAW